MTSLVRARELRPPLVDVDRGRDWVELMAPAVELAKAIATTEFVPRALRNNPAAITAAILYGDEVGLGPMQSLAKIHVIEGRPFMAAEAQRALVYAAGHDLWLEESSTTRAIWAGRRAGSDQITRITFSMEDARRAHLDGKPNWKGYPRAMLSARASAELVRAVFADVIGGLAALEEVDDLEDLATGTDARPRPTRARRPRATAEAKLGASAAGASSPAAALSAPMPPLPGEDDAPTASGAPSSPPETLYARQHRRLMALFRERGYGGSGALERGRRLKLSEEVVGHSLSSSKELTPDEADRIIDYLESVRPPGDGDGPSSVPDDSAAGPADDEAEVEPEGERLAQMELDELEREPFDEREVL